MREDNVLQIAALKDAIDSTNLGESEVEKERVSYREIKRRVGWEERVSYREIKKSGMGGTGT